MKPSRWGRWWRGWRAAAVPTPRARSEASITAGALISLLFCRANYSEPSERPPRVLNDRESFERGQTGAGEGGRQSRRAGWHLNSLFSALHRQLYRPFRVPAGLFFLLVSPSEWRRHSTRRTRRHKRRRERGHRGRFLLRRRRDGNRLDSGEG